MVLLIFALHLRTLSPPLLSQIKQCLLEVANLNALSSKSKRGGFGSSVDDLIGLCYFQCSENPSSDELKIAYSPRGKVFSLRDLHYAVNRLPSDSYSPPLLEESFLFCDLDISCLLSHELLQCTGRKDIDRKIVFISSCLVKNMESNSRKCLMDAVDRGVSVEFVFFEQNSNQLCEVSESINKFRGQICDLPNCTFNAYLPDGQVFNALVKRWVRELKTDDIMQWQAYLVFQRSITGSVNEIFCKLCNSTNDIVDELSPCKPCRCSWDGKEHQMSKDHFPSDYGNASPEQEHIDRQSVKVDEHTLPIEESWRSWMGHCPVSSAVYLNVSERTNLASLSEGVMVGKAYIVAPSDTADGSDKCHLNNRLFLGLCHSLYSLNQGLVCWTSCNIETMSETTFQYYYILQPSDNGLMLLRRLAGAEEILPFPNLNITDSSIDKEFKDDINQCLQQVELRDYNPVQHIGGFHQKINQRFYENFQSGLISSDVTTMALDITSHDSPQVQPSFTTNAPNPQTEAALENDTEILELTQEWEQLVNESTPKTIKPNSTPTNPNPDERISEEWEQFIIGGNIQSPWMDPKPPEPDLKKSKKFPTVTQKTIDTKTSEILERLGNPKLMKTKSVSPIVGTNVSTNGGSMIARLSARSQGPMTTSCLLKPTFNRMKRKQR